MIISDHKIEYLDKKTQVVILDEKGSTIDSCNTLFPISTFGDHTINSLPFLESIWSTIVAYEIDQPIDFPCIKLDINDVVRYCDNILTKKIENGKILIVWIITDFTDHYTSLVSLQQQRNESDIKGEFLELEQKNILLQKQLLELKNNELQRIQQFKERFYASLSHEIRTPISNIIGLVELLKSKPAHEKMEEYFYSLEVTGQHLVAIVNDVLDLSKIEAGKLTLKEEVFDINEILRTVFYGFESVSKQKSLELKYSHTGDIPTAIIGDKTKLTQILYNLVGNSIKFTEKGVISLGVHYQKPTSSIINVRLTIKDTGIGISSKNLPSIFDPYEQIDNDLAIKGTGLGLNIVKKLVELMDGKIKVTSELDVGTTFFVSLPFKIVSDTAEEVSSKTKNQHSIKGKTILVVDDDTTSLVVLRDFLTSHGANVSTTNSATSALRILSREMFDVLLLDYHLPDMKTERLLENINGEILNMNRLVPIIILTGDTDSSIADRLIGKGVEGIIHKPFVPDELVQAVDTASRSFHKYGLEDLSIETDMDLRYLHKIMDGNKKNINNMLETFCQTMPKNIELLINRFTKNEATNIEEIAHKAKSGCAYLGMHKIQRILHSLESDAQNGRALESYQSILPQIQNSMIRIVEDLEKKLKDNK